MLPIDINIAAQAYHAGMIRLVDFLFLYEMLFETTFTDKQGAYIKGLSDKITIGSLISDLDTNPEDYECTTSLFHLSKKIKQTGHTKCKVMVRCSSPDHTGLYCRDHNKFINWMTREETEALLSYSIIDPAEYKQQRRIVSIGYTAPQFESVTKNIVERKILAQKKDQDKGTQT